MSDGSGDLDKTRQTSPVGEPDAALQNDLLAAWLDDVAADRVHGVAHYQAMFPGRETEVAAELARLHDGDEVDDGERLPRIPDVEILEKIGSGGQGVVYRGRQVYIEREVAVKVFAPRFWSESFAERFHREAKTLASLRHPNIVACYQAGTTDAGLGFMVMEYVDGPNLRQWLAEHGPMSPRDALLLGRELARALDHAHDATIIHRDVKPENVLLRPLAKPMPGGLPFEVKLADLGLARVGSRVVGGRAATQLTPVGAVMGSPMTMAPEQFDDPENVDFRADVYGLGCVLFHAITGRSAFQSTQLTAMIKAKVDGSAPDVRDVEATVVPALAVFIQSMLAADPAKRPNSHAEVAERCEQLAGGGADPSRRRAMVAAIVFLVLSTIAFVAWDPLGMVRAPTVLVVTTRDATEGQVVTLRAEATGRGTLTYRWRQIGEPPVRLTDPNAPLTTFLAPRGLGPHEFEFAVTVANRWRAASQTQRVLVGAIPELAPLQRGESRSLLRNDELAVVADWQKTSDMGTWAGAQDHIGANGYCNRGTTSRSRLLPRGHWLLTGAIEPFDVHVEGGTKRTERAGLQFEFSSGHVVEFVVQRGAAATGFVAGVGHRLAHETAPLRLIDPNAGAWAENKPITFEIEWTGSALRCSYGTGQGASDWVSRSIETRSLPTAFSPHTLTLFVNNGRACFCKLALEGR